MDLKFINSIISNNTIRMTSGTNTDWGMPTKNQLVRETITLGGGIPDPSLIPYTELSKGFDYIKNYTDDTFFRYGGPVGYEILRQELAKHYSSSASMYNGNQFILTNGSAGAIELIIKSIIDPDDVIVVESPTFSGSLRTFRGYQAKILSVPVDEFGMDIDQLEKLLINHKRKIKLVYTISNFHNPSGVSLSMERRKQLIDLSKKYQFLIIDDDAYGEIGFNNYKYVPLRDMDSQGHVLTVGTFSKTIATGLRIGWICTDENLAKKILANRFDMGNSPILHGIIAHFIQSGEYAKHVKKIQGIYSRKLDVLLDSLNDINDNHIKYFKPNGGFFLWLHFKNASAKKIQNIALKNGLAFPHGSVFFPEDEYKDSYIRLAFSKNSEDELIRSGDILSKSLLEL
ncbi:MAG: PLP-dependent aminotransferase family protein [Dehalococcoidia bacterium]|jgi:2-aminoadipate transaminase|nr:MAG: 2-aminoadipate transaminase [Chloroflexota bacterium]|tara:strand:- start:1333 stop:2532 length:1200 start_codon:yes stop_codon:yes gene_type:complete